MNYDLIIIGGGPAGLTSAIYATRRKLSTLVVSANWGGQTSLTLKMENYPGHPDISGLELVETMKRQAQSFGSQFLDDTITEIKKTDNSFTLTTAGGKTYTAKAVILALGKTHRHLDIEGETEFANKGVVYCATCDALLFGGKDVVVVGGGNSAVDAALLLSKIANKIYLLHRRNEFRAERVLLDKLHQASNIEIITNAVPVKISGSNFVESMDIKFNSGETKTLSVQGVFVEVGWGVDSAWLKDLIKLNEAGEIIIDSLNATSLVGIFAAGDATNVAFKQTVIAAGEGAKAALAAYNYLQGESLSGLSDYAQISQ